jgi:hypothetical protein
MSLNHKVFNNLTTGFNLSTKRDLTDPDLVHLSPKNFQLGLENSYSQSFRANYDVQPLAFVTSTWSYSASYSDNYDKSSKTRSTNLSQNWSVSGQFRHQALLGSGSRKAQSDGSGSRSDVRGGVAKDDSQQGGSPFYEPLLDGLRFLTGWLNPFSYKYNTSRRKSAPGLVSKASWKYRLGLQSDPGVEVGSTNRNPSSGETVGYEFGSGFQLLGGIVTTIGYNRSVNRDLLTIGRDRTEKTSTGWPQLSLRIGTFTHMPLIKNQLNWFIRVFSPRTGFSRQVSENTNVSRGFTTSRSETISRSPIVSLNFKILRTLSLSGSYSASRTTDEKFNPASGAPQSETRSSRRSIAASTNYAFTSPTGISIPLFGKLKFKSTVSIDVRVKYSSSMSETSSAGGPFVVGTQKSDFSVSPSVRYAFSQQINGGLTATWQDNTDSKFNSKSHMRMLQIWTEIKF